MIHGSRLPTRARQTQRYIHTDTDRETRSDSDFRLPTPPSLPSPSPSAIVRPGVTSPPAHSSGVKSSEPNNPPERPFERRCQCVWTLVSCVGGWADYRIANAEPPSFSSLSANNLNLTIIRGLSSDRIQFPVVPRRVLTLSGSATCPGLLDADSWRTPEEEADEELEGFVKGPRLLLSDSIVPGVLDLEYHLHDVFIWPSC